MFMSSHSDNDARRGAVLAELAEIGMAMARGLRDEMEAAETPETKARAMAGFTKIARTVRQCVALEARLERDAARAAVEAQAREDGHLQRRIRRRKAHVTRWIQRAICNDAQDDDEGDDLAAERMEDLRERLDENLLDADFADRPLGEVVALLCADLGLDPDRILGDKGEDPEDPDEEPEDDPGEGDPPPDDPIPEGPPPEHPPPEDPSLEDRGGPQPQPAAPEDQAPQTAAPRREPPPWAHASYRDRFG
jgi:hypothetical protein